MRDHRLRIWKKKCHLFLRFLSVIRVDRSQTKSLLCIFDLSFTFLCQKVEKSKMHWCMWKVSSEPKGFLDSKLASYSPLIFYSYYLLLVNRFFLSLFHLVFHLRVSPFTVKFQHFAVPAFDTTWISISLPWFPGQSRVCSRFVGGAASRTDLSQKPESGAWLDSEC